ncbi:hypothetical protein KY343_02515 [Candidatus Woesearchaeota archaeon]|nr:hypothetical protein [Candidatus Woesearchaeota archaeon]
MRRLGENGVRGLLERVLDRDDITIVDPHTHILSSDVKEAGAEYNYAKAIKEKRIDFVFETEHDRAPLLYGSDKPINGHIRPGVEVSTNFGHVNLLTTDADFIKECLKKYSRELFRSRNSELHLETLLNYIRDHHQKTENRVVVAFPHSFQQGGILCHEDNRKSHKLWLPSRYKQRKYFLEWTNSKRSPDSRTAGQVLGMVQDNRYKLFLVAGSDAHQSSEVGMAGVVIYGKIDGDAIAENLLEGNYLVYHIQSFDEDNGRLMTNSPCADDTKEFLLQGIDNIKIIPK